MESWGRCLVNVCGSFSKGLWYAVVPDQQIKLSVGGSVFWVSMKEILEAGSPLLTEVLHAGPYDDGEYFLDRDGTYFHYTIDYIRRGRSAFVGEASSGQTTVHVSYEVRRRLLLEAKVLGLSDMQASLEELDISTPLTSSSGREAREAVLRSHRIGVVRSESDLSILEGISQEGARMGDLQAFACCNPVAITYTPPKE
eukprot:TRINITY_DN65765_c0_g1_i1.p1 TRINITY_DN65765_c0_g1~~TRINITY_DN65765_c0_g1_i1.p1  ORF type:complete len:198 (+),score=30.35 TRINITY_DN65765_c0_g1_i1:106-699(+)